MNDDIILKYLKECSRDKLAEHLINVPEIRNSIDNTLTKGIRRLAEFKIPKKLLNDYYLEPEYGKSCLALKQYIIQNFKEEEKELLLQSYNLKNL